MSDDQKEKHLTPCPEIDTCKMCERFCTDVLEKLDPKTEVKFKVGQRVKVLSGPYTEVHGEIMELPIPTHAWVRLTGSSKYETHGFKLEDLELLVEKRPEGLQSGPDEKPIGSVKKDDNKYDPTMLTMEMVELVSRVRQFGAKKYARGNFKITGFKYTRSLAAALRHIFAFLNGEDNDPESGLSHLGHAICSIEHCIYDTKNHPENDDRKE